MFKGMNFRRFNDNRIHGNCRIAQKQGKKKHKEDSVTYDQIIFKSAITSNRGMP